MQTSCKCKSIATKTCDSCKRQVCDDCNCGTDTVLGFLCGTYTQWGCARKFTNCDECLDSLAIHESDLNNCGCGASMCDSCFQEHDCSDKEQSEQSQSEQSQSEDKDS